MTTLQSIKDGERHWLADKGTSTQLYEIGPYAILEYIREGKSYYSIFVDGIDKGQSSDDFEAALAQAMAIKFDGINSQAGRFFALMIKGEIRPK